MGNRHSATWLRPALFTSIAFLTLIASALGALAFLGMLPGVGPMDPRQELGGTAIMNAEVGRPIAYTALWVYNPSRVDATIDDVVPIGDSPIEVVSVWLPAPTHDCGNAAVPHPLAAPEHCRISADGYVLPAGTPTGNGPRLVVVLRADHAGVYRSRGFDIHYHVGPISYTTTYNAGMVLRVRSPSS